MDTPRPGARPRLPGPPPRYGRTGCPSGPRSGTRPAASRAPGSILSDQQPSAPHRTCPSCHSARPCSELPQVGRPEVSRRRPVFGTGRPPLDSDPAETARAGTHLGSATTPAPLTQLLSSRAIGDGSGPATRRAARYRSSPEIRVTGLASRPGGVRHIVCGCSTAYTPRLG